MRNSLSAATCTTTIRFVLLSILVLVPLVFATNTVEMFEYPKTAVLQLGAIMLAAGIGAAAVAAWPRLATAAPLPGAKNRGKVPLPTPPSRSNWRAWWNGDWTTVGVALFGLSACLSTIFSLSPGLSLGGAHESFAGLGTVAAYGLIFLASRYFASNYQTVRALLAGVVVASTAAAIYALFQAMHLDPLPWADVSTVGSFARPMGPLGHANHLGEVLALACAPTVYFTVLAFRQRRWRACAALAAALLCSVLAILVSLSRAGWLAMAASVLVLLAGLWPQFGRRGQRHASLLLCFCGLVLAAVTLGGYWPASVHRRLEGLLVMDGRLLLWQAALDIAGKYPVFGSGLETFQIGFCAVRTPAYWTLEWGVLPNHAHNQFLHILATQGTFGLLAAAVVLVGACTAARRAWLTAPAAERQQVVVLLAMLAAFVTTSLFSFTVAAVGATVAATLGMLAGLGTMRHREQAASATLAWAPWSIGTASLVALVVLLGNIHHAGKSEALPLVLTFVAGLAMVGWACCCLALGKPAPAATALQASGWRTGAVQAVIACAAVGIAVVWVVGPYEADLLCKHGEDVFDDDPVGAIRFLQQAIAMDGNRECYWTKLAGAWHARALRTSDAQERQAYFEEARHALEKVCQLQPLSGYHQDNLGRLLGAMAARGLAAEEDVFAAFDAALERDPCNALFCMDAAQAALGLREAGRCRRYAEMACRLDPLFAAPQAQLGFAALLERHWQEGCSLLENAVLLEWREQSGEAVVARANLVMAHFQVHNFRRVCDLAPPLLEGAPQLQQVRTALEESRRRLRE